MERVGLLTFVLALFWVFQGRAQTPAPGEIELSYDSNVIASGSTTISAGAGTDYGVGFIGNDANLHPSIEYQISNTDNSGIINVSNIYFDGDNSTDFSISGITFPVAIGAGESISFMVAFAPVSALSGPEDLTPVDLDRVAELHVISNDLDESDYAFSIGGMAAGEATVQVGVEIAGETNDDIHGYYTFANIAEELLATYSRTGADGIKTVLGVVDTVFGCGDNRGVGTHPSSDDAILTINPQGVLPDQRWYFFFDDNSVAGYPVRNTTGYAGIGTTLYTGTGTATALLSGVGLDGAYTDYLFFVEPAYEAMMGNTPTTFTNLELLGEYYADTIFLDSRVLISDPDLQVLNAGQGFYNGSTLQIERQGGANADDYFQLEESILFSLRNDSIFTQEYYIGQYDNTGHQMTLNFEGSSQVIVSQRMLNDIVQRITYYNANGVTAPLSFSYVFDDGTSETTGIKTVNPNIEEVFYVDINATGLNNGTSWVNAYNSLQDALARASSGDQVWVAAGEYLPTSGTDREASFRVASGVSIYGSLPSGASALTAQDTAAYPTILSGNIGDPATNTDNVYNVVTFGPVSDFTLLKGLHITGGYADRSDNFFYGNGAGVFNSNFATDSTSGVVLQDLMLYGNTAVLNGGAVYSNGSIWISGCNIFQNEAEDGGAVYNGGIIRISSCDISQNQAADGSGIYNDNAVVAFSGTNCVLRDVKIHHNTAGDDGGGIASKEAISVYDCDISNNEIDGSGGACYFDLDEGTLGDSIRIVRTKLNNNLLTDTEDEGTAVYMNSDCPVPPVVLFAECLVQGNEGEDGTFYFDVDGDNGDIIVFLESCLFSGNTVYDDGAALMGSDDTQFWVYNTTFAGNYADDDGCVIETGSSSKATLYNCISFGNDANDGSDGIIEAAGDIDIFNCYFEHGEDRMSVDGDLSVNTLFTADDFEDAAFEDFTFDAVNDTPTAEGNFALSKISPLVNLGDNGYATNLEKDLGGNARLQEGTVDLGAYESSPLFFTGLGTAVSPYQIKDWEHLHNVRFRMDAHFILINDLDKNSSGYQEYVADTGWLPIGTMDGDVLNGTGTVTGFTGHFDGQGYSINNLQIDNGLSYGNGLFFALGAFEGANLMKADEEDFFPSVIVDPSFLDSLQSLGGAMVHNLKLDSATVGSSIMFSGDNLPLFPNGILAGFVHNSQIDSISASGTIRMGGGVVGAVLESQATNTQLSFLTTHIENELLGAGIAGCLGINTLVTDSRAHIQSSDQGLPVGISLLNAGAVSRCFATVTSTLATPSPPFLPSGISWLLSGKIEESAAQVNFSFGAGLAAFSLSGQINNAYVTGNIAQGAGVVYQNSGLVGNTYVAIETDSVAGLFGINSGMVSNSFWDAELSGLSESAAGEGKTTCEMKAADLFTAAGWDFEGETNNGNEEIWRIVDSASTVSYPYLSALTYDAIGAVPEVNPIPGLDTLLPTAVCMDITAYLDASGEASIMPGDIGAGSMISCDTLTLSLSQTAFSCDEQGENTVVLTTTDSANNTDTCSAIVTVLDTIAPVASCTDLTVYLDNAGEGTISPAQADGGSTDNCGSVSLSLSDSTFTCDDLSLNTEAILGSGAGFRSPQSASSVSVVLIATDGSDNIDSCMLTVTVLDTISPVMACTDVPVLLDEMGAASIDVSDVDTGTTDNCGTPMLQLSQTSFSCSDIGEVSVSLTATDGSGNSNSCEVMVTVSGPDTDCDGDGLTNAEEDELGTDSFAADTDGDGVIDGTEVSDMTSPTDACSFVLGSQSVAQATDWNMSDCDGDGLSNAEEADTYSTNPLEADTDGDGVTDGSEVADSSSPLEICDYVYSSVTLPKGEAWANEDCDGDGLSNEVEGDEATDTDGDLVPDCFDLDSDNDGLLDATEQGTGQGNDNTAFLAMIAADIDGDSILNFRDVDSDGDGCFDAVEASDDLTPADLDSEGRIPGGVDENGVPLTAGMEGFAAAEAWSSNEIAGEFCGSDIGGYVWLDNDRNGLFLQQEASLPGTSSMPSSEEVLPGVQVRLYGTDLNGNPVDEVQTADADGYYLFELVLAGDYCMEVSFEGLDNAEDYVLTIPNVEFNTIDSLDSDYSLEGELCFTLEAGASSVYDLNAGVFLDADGDFIPDVNDPDIGGEMLDPQGFIYCENTGEIISGATIEVTGPGNVTVIADGSTGFYQWFVDASGVYTMTLNTPSGYGISTDCTDSGQLDPEPGITIVGSSEEAMSGFMEDASCGANPFYMEFVLSPGDLVLNNNLPLVCAEIGDRAWKDFDRDGLQSPGEPGLGYTEVRLLDCAGNGVDTVVSDIEGRFLFTGLPAGGYVLDYEGRAEWGGSLPNLWSYAGYQAGAAELDSDITASGSTECVTLGVGEKDYTVDGGYEVPYTYSCNCDGSITLEWSPVSGEAGVTYTVDIEDSAGNPVLDYVNMTETSVTIAHGTLQNGEEYRLAVTENISTSNVVSITGPLYADCNPVPMASVISAAGPACPGGTDGSVSFELEESGCAGRYAVYLEQDGSDILVAADTTLAGSFSVSGLGEGSYSLRVELLDTLSCGYGLGCFPLEVEDFVSLSNQDSEAPALAVSTATGTPAADVSYASPEGECGVQLEWLAEVSDNCTAGGAIALSVSIESDVAGAAPWAMATQTSSGYAVSLYAGIGTNTVVLTATDEAGNSTELSYEITVVDSRAPEIT
ncbi:SdrD B-like domain-containing protein, partial [Phaeodactylibacter luteus]